MTPNEFRKLALSFPETSERAHMNHPDFRVAGKIFATLGYPHKEFGMVKVTPVEQEMLVQAEPAVFTPVNGAWGRHGCTSVNMKAAKKPTLRRALAAAWRLAAPESLAKQFPDAAVAGSIESHRVGKAKTSGQKVRRSVKNKRSRDARK